MPDPNPHSPHSLGRRVALKITRRLGRVALNLFLDPRLINIRRRCRTTPPRRNLPALSYVEKRGPTRLRTSAFERPVAGQERTRVTFRDRLRGRFPGHRPCPPTSGVTGRSPPKSRVIGRNPNHCQGAATFTGPLDWPQKPSVRPKNRQDSAGYSDRTALNSETRE